MSPETSDPERLAELEAFAILDTAPEEAFDDAVQIARTICAAPVALVSLVAADRQWFKARVGFPPCETELNASVCQYALSEPDLLIIPDLTQDPRTRDNPLVTGPPWIRFYAGAPLRTSSGRALGSLCVIDNVPRPGGLNEEQADALRRLARQIMILMRERRQLSRLQAEERLTRAASIRRAALIELGDHLRDLASVAAMTAKAAEIVGRTLDAGRAGYGEIDASGSHVTVLEDWTAPGAESLAGTHRFADFGRLGASIARGDALAVGAMLDVPVRERGRTVGLFFVHAAAPRDWLPEEVAFARNVADRVQVGIGRVRAEEQQAVLNRELSHRMKNTLAMVQAIAMQTMRNATDLEAARDALANRLIALGKAHDILLDGTRESASLEKVVHGALTIHDDAQAGRLRLFGPHVQVGSKAALSLTLMIHELATNAAKYGALSTPAGFVVVDWSIDAGVREPMVRLRWAESGGPPVATPTRLGFGSRLIERGLAGAIGGEVRLTYPPDGVLCELAVPLSGMEADE